VIFIFCFQASGTAGTFTNPGSYVVKYACENSSLFEKMSVSLSPLISYDLFISQTNNKSLKNYFVSVDTDLETQHKAQMVKLHMIVEICQHFSSAKQV